MTIQGFYSSIEGILQLGQRSLPKIAIMIAICVGGFFISKMMGRFAVAFAKRSRLEALMEKLDVSKLLYAVGYKQSFAKVFGYAFYYLGLLITLAVLAEVGDVVLLRNFLNGVFAFLPKLLCALLMVAVGVWTASILRGFVRQFAGTESLDSPGLVAQATYYVVLGISVILALEQAGLEIGFLTELVLLVAGGLIAALALGFGLGAKDSFGSLVARYTLQSTVVVGDRIRIDGGDEGKVLDFTTTAVVLETAQGTRVLECSSLRESGFIVLPRS